jgi:hypothetical protein
MLHLGKRIEPAPPASADLTNDPARSEFRAWRGGRIRLGGLGKGLESRRRHQVHTGRIPKGRLIRHAGALPLAIFALAVAMIRTPFGGLLMAAVSLAALQTAGSFPATGAAVTLPTITVRTEIKHRAARRKLTHALAKDSGTSHPHRFREGALDNRRRSWQDDSREQTWSSFDRGHQ